MFCTARKRTLAQAKTDLSQSIGISQQFPARLRLAHAVNGWEEILRLGCARSGFRQEAPARLSPGSGLAHASITAQNKTGAYSPPRFSAPALKALQNQQDQAAHLLPANLFVKQRRVCKSKMDEKLCKPRCLAAARRVNEKGVHSIYLVDSKQGGIDSTQADVYCAELESGGFFKVNRDSRVRKAVGAT